MSAENPIEYLPFSAQKVGKRELAVALNGRLKKEADE